jgi:hypothetical protein
MLVTTLRLCIKMALYSLDAILSRNETVGTVTYGSTP